MKNVIQYFKQGAAVLALAGMMSACDSSSTEKENTDSDTMSAASPDANSGMMSSDASKSHAEAALAGTNSDTTVAGTVQFDAQSDGKVKMTLDITVDKEPNKTIAVHIHENGACSDMGKAAGGHWNPTSMDHGKWGSSAYHAGDIGNIKLDGSGKGTMTMETDQWTIGGDAKTNILGKAIIVHAGEDDYTSQPSGNSGSRIGCGTIQ